MRTSTYTDTMAPGKSPWKDKKPLLGWLDVEITERCNNNCIHCSINLPAGDRTARDRELGTPEIKDILRQAVSLGCLCVRFTGGEPLLRGDFEDLYIFARQQGLKVLLFTNATLITPSLADLFGRMPPLEPVEITVYGMHRESYEAVTGVAGSFDTARRGIDLLLEREVPFVVKGTVLPPNRDELGEFEAWAAAVIRMDAPPSYSMLFELRERRDSQEKNRQIRALRLSPDEGLHILTRRPDEYRKGMGEFCSRFTSPPGDMLFSCGAGVGRTCLDAYGRLQACLALRHPDTTYDLRAGSLEDAMTRFFPEVRRMRARDHDYLTRCARCFLKGLCQQCPASSWSEHGSLDTPVEYLCEVAHTQARYLGLVEEDEWAWEVQDWRKRINALIEDRKSPEQAANV